MQKKKARFSEPFLCKFTPEMAAFIEEEVQVYGNKSIVIRKGISILMRIREAEREREKVIR